MIHHAVTVGVEEPAAAAPGFNHIIFIVLINSSVTIIIQAVDGQPGSCRRVQHLAVIGRVPLDLLHLSPVVQQQHNIRRHVIGGHRKHAGVICPAIHGRQGYKNGADDQPICISFKSIHTSLQPTRFT